MPTANTIIQDELTAREVELDRYRRGVAVRVLNLLARLEEAIIARMASSDPTQVQPRYRQARLTRLLAEVGLLVDKYGKDLEAEVMPDMRDLARHEADFGVRMFGDVIPVAVETIAPTAATLQAAVMTRPFQGRLLREWVAEHPPAVRARLRGVIRQGVAEGQTIDDMVRAVRGTAAQQYRDGVMEVSRRGADAMVRTAVSHTVAAARDVTYHANRDLVKGVQMVATLDSHTTVFCMGIDGKVFPLGKGPRPPFHIRCRTTSVPVLKSWREMGIKLPDAPDGTRASMDGQVAAAQDYSTWLRGRSADFQDEVLGRTRADLFRKGGLPLDKFTDSSARSYTLDELRRRELAAFRRAGLD